MTYDQQLALWFLATVAPFCLNSFFGRRPDAIGLSGMIVVGWCLERVCWVIWTPPEAMQFYPLIDAAFGITTTIAWVTARRRWKLALMGVFTFQCCLHLAWWGGYPADAHNLLTYLVVNNLAYALELIIVASPGVEHALAGMARLRESGVSRLRHHASP